MTGFLAGLGGKLAERWLSRLTLPGCLFLAALCLAFALGQEHAVDRHHLVEAASDWYEKAQGARPGTLAVAAVGTALTATLAGLGCRVVAHGMGWLWFDASENPLNKPIRDTEEQVGLYYRVDLKLLWPRLWLVLSPTVRNELRAAITAVDTAVGVGAWGVVYLVLGLWWWPAAVGGAAMLAVGLFMARERAADLAALMETAVDIGLRPVARSLGVTPPPASSPADLGRLVSPFLNKRAAVAASAGEGWVVVSQGTPKEIRRLKERQRKDAVPETSASPADAQFEE
ncbi:hypothetical protein ABZ249_08575 [Nocardiopsis sp. NPDC006139]|uniref:hypothetical protein n=1 Tax=unclassified Nocardiopsis TaxID=2649073 RepID=UPI0033BA3A64